MSQQAVIPEPLREECQKPVRPSVPIENQPGSEPKPIKQDPVLKSKPEVSIPPNSELLEDEITTPETPVGTFEKLEILEEVPPPRPESPVDHKSVQPPRPESPVDHKSVQPPRPESPVGQQYVQPSLEDLKVPLEPRKQSKTNYESPNK